MPCPYGNGEYREGGSNPALFASGESDIVPKRVLYV
jgi:hypothetical protein